jgi:hypothetical protein
MERNYQELKEQFKTLRDTFPDPTGLRIHRGLGWLHAAEETEDPDTRFLLLWIAFNAIYAQDFSEQNTFGEKGLLKKFIGQLVRLDRDDLIYRIIWDNYSDKIRLFISNKHISRWFWDFQNGKLSETAWEKKFAASQREIHQALGIKDTTCLCSTLFDRIYVLRNQIMHGGATWRSSVNRSQVKVGTQVLGLLIPAMIRVMIENPDHEWGTPCFPPVDE